MRRLLPLLVAVSLAGFGADKKPPKQKEVKVQKSSMPVAQEIELGKQAAAEVEREMEIVKNPEAEGWLNRIGAQLAKTPQANSYPYYFQLVNEPSINAFALPGGPMFVHTGLIKAADNEAQVAGVLAHEMSHVALRHGVSQMGKTQTWQTVLGLAGAAAGMTGQGGLIGTAINAGGSLGVNGILSKYSRDAERDADLNGARMLAAAGYDPLEMARFFAKLEEESKTSHPQGLEAWFASHPSPGRRVEAVSDDIKFYPAKAYGADTGQFVRIKETVASLAPPLMKPAVALQPIQAKPREGLPQGFTDLRTKDFTVAYPTGWEAGQADAGGSLYLTPKGGAVKQEKGGVELIAGAMIDYHPVSGEAKDLEAATNELLELLRKGDANLKVLSTESATVGGKPAKLMRLTTKTSYPQDPEQVVQLYTAVRPAGLWTLALAFPKSTSAQAEPIMRQILQTVAFAE